MNNEPLKESGRFVLITPNDLLADRWVKAAYLDWSDPAIYGSWRFLKDYFFGPERA